MSNSYQRSKTGKQCIGPCYNAFTNVIHPITMEYVNLKNPFCPTNKWEHVDENGDTKTLYVDECYLPNNSTTEVNKKDLQLSILLPQIEFHSMQFLATYYKIRSYDDALDWLEKNEHVPTNNKKRIIDEILANSSYDEYMVNNQLSEFIIEYIKKMETKQLYEKIGKYVNIKNNEPLFDNPNNIEISLKTDYIKRLNFIIFSMLTNDSVTRFLVKNLESVLLDLNKDPDNIHNKSVTENIVAKLIEYIEKKIKSSFD